MGTSILDSRTMVETLIDSTTDSVDRRLLRAAWGMIARHRREIRSLELRARQGLTAAGAMAVSLFNQLIDNPWVPSSGRSCWFWCCGCVLWIAGAGALVIALIPKATPIPRIRVTSRDDARAILLLVAEQVMKLAVRELDQVRRAVVRKQRLVALGVIALVAATILLVVSAYEGPGNERGPDAVATIAMVRLGVSLPVVDTRRSSRAGCPTHAAMILDHSLH